LQPVMLSHILSSNCEATWNVLLISNGVPCCVLVCSHLSDFPVKKGRNWLRGQTSNECMRKEALSTNTPVMKWVRSTCWSIQNIAEMPTIWASRTACDS
jgi:hypothetical protein